MKTNRSRRNFLTIAPLAAAAGIPLAETFLLASNAAAAQTAAPEPSQLFTAEKIADAVKTFQSQLGEHYLYQPKSIPMTIAMTSQEKHVAKDFEYHEGRDHVFLILDGATTFEVGGTPQDPRNTRPGEWNAPSSEGASVMQVKKGDMLVIPRGTPHRQSTEKSVTWLLISSSGAIKA